MPQADYSKPPNRRGLLPQDYVFFFEPEPDEEEDEDPQRPTLHFVPKKFWERHYCLIDQSISRDFEDWLPPALRIHEVSESYFEYREQIPLSVITEALIQVGFIHEPNPVWYAQGHNVSYQDEDYPEDLEDLEGD